MTAPDPSTSSQAARPAPSRARRVAIRVLVTLAALTGVLIVGLGALVLASSAPLPEGEGGAKADALARAIQAEANVDAWAKTGAVRWDHPGGRAHLWDRSRHLARVGWDDVEVTLDLNRRDGLVTRGGQPLDGPEADAHKTRAWSLWANDSFWLNPLAKLFDDGVTRALVIDEDGSEALLVRYDAGGVTPGDSYLWRLKPDTKQPRAWRAWTQILPVQGLEFTWEAWTALPTGAKVATLHRTRPVPLITLHLQNVQAAATLAELQPGPDPFAPMLKALGPPPNAAPSSAPTSAP